MLNQRRWFVIVLAALLLVIALPVLAQEACPALIEQALAELSGNCGGMDRNSACYGFNRVDATFNAEVEEGFFSDPADRSQLVTLQTIATAPLDTELERWGIAVLNAQANVPNSLPGQAVTFILVGDVELENAVPPDQAFAGGETIPVAVLTGSNLRSFPSTNANIVATATRGDELQADGISPDKQWLRVLSPTGSAWISISLIDGSADLSSLPEVTQETRSPMQAFYFTTGASEPDCNEVPPSTLVIQGPENFRVDLTANGADIRIASTVGLRTLENGQMQLFVMDGAAIVDGVTVPPGFTLFIPLSEDGKSVGGPVTGLRPMMAEELEDFKLLELFEGDFLHYPIKFPPLADIMQTLAAIQSSSGGSGGVSGNTIVGGAGNANMCRNFKPTSPFARLPYETLPFYWDPAAGATHYRLTIYSDNGNIAYQQITRGAETNWPVDAGALGPGTNFTWQVEALVNGQVACISALVSVARDFNPNEPTPVPNAPFAASWTCNGFNPEVKFSWSSLPAGETVTLTFVDSFYGPTGGTFSGSSGSAIIGSYDAGPGSVTTSGGQSISLPPIKCGC